MRAVALPLMLSVLLPAAALAQAGPPAPDTVRAPKTSGVAGGTSRSAPVNGVLVLYGNERCPTNANGEEIVVCSRRPAEEQFRIPKELRNFEVTPENQSWAAKSAANAGVGAVGVGTCSTVGANGATGCMVQNATRWKREQRAAVKTANDVP